MADALTPSQRKVVTFPYQPNSTVQIVAGPGSGKTLTLLHKVHHLIESGQVAPNEILILSLTNRAVDNVTTRLFDVFEALNERQTEEQLKETVNGIEIHTIHGLANRVVIEKEGIISVIEENGWRGLMKLVSDDFWKNQRPKIPNTKDFKKLFEKYKNDKSGKNEVVKKLVEVMRNCGVVTNDELIIRASEYLNESQVQDSAAVDMFQYTSALKYKIKVVIIDEFQDLYPSLLPLIQQIARGKQLLLFGDSNQSIYSFLGSNKVAMEGIEAIHTGEDLHVLHLHDNFRCTPEIMSTATQVINSKLRTVNNGGNETICKDQCGVEPIIENFTDVLDELEYVKDQICQLVCASAKLSDVAILTRTNNQMQLIADHLQLAGIKSRKLTAQPDWMNDTRIQFLIDLMKVISLTCREEHFVQDGIASRSWKSDFSIIVTLSALRGVGNQSIQILYSECQRQNTSLWRYISTVPKSDWPSELTNKRQIVAYTEGLKRLIDSGELSSCNDPMQILHMVCTFAQDMSYQMFQPRTQHDANQFKDHLEDMYRVLKLCLSDKPNEMPLIDWFLQTHFEQSLAFHHQTPNSMPLDQDALSLSTIHSSKGLEFPIVFLIGGMISVNSFDQVEDNVLYVGMTRAKNLLYLINTKHPRLSNPVVKKNVLTNEAFWRYYNADLRRVVPANLSTASQRYELLRQKRIGCSQSIRPLSSLSAACTRKFIRFMK